MTGSNISAREQQEALDPTVGSGTPQDAPWEAPAVGFLQREPVVALGLALGLPAAGAALEAVLAGAEIRAVLIAAGSALVAAGMALVRKVVTPVARPRVDEETPLVVK